MIDVMERLNMGLKDFRNKLFQLNKMSKILLDLTKNFQSKYNKRILQKQNVK